MCVAILFAVVYASPIAVDESIKKQDSIPLKVVDVPAGVFDLPAESVDKKVEDKIQPDSEIPVDVKQIEILDDANKPEKEGEDVVEEGPNVFGIRFPTIMIIRRPQVYQDPFAGFQSPFFSGRPSRPSIFSSFGSSFDEPQNKEKVDEKEALPSSLNGDQQEDEQQRNETVIANNVIQRMHQQIGNLFANLFNPDTFFMPRPNYQRPTFPRPTFSRPSLFSPFSGFDETEDDEKLDFDKLPANYSNSTSETKIVDGQLVTVNKTVHRISGNNSNGFFHFSVIKVRPNEPAAVAEELPTAVPSDTPLKISEGETKPVEFAEPDPKMNEVDRPEDEQVSNKGVDSGLLA